MSISPTYFYHQSIRKAVVIFGTLFNDIQVKKPDDTYIKIPLTYASKQKWFSRLIQKMTHLNDDGRVDTTEVESMTFPRMAYILNSLQYDPSRKISSVQKIVAKDSNEPKDSRRKRIFAPVPYTLSFELYLISRTMEDGLQIIEQIVPFFTPRFSVTTNEIPEIGIERDIEIILNDGIAVFTADVHIDNGKIMKGVSYQSDFEGSFDTFNLYNWTLDFAMEYNLYPPVRNEKIVKKVTVETIPALSTLSMYEKSNYTVDPFDAEIEDEWKTIFSKSIVSY